jgi:hypothetical protein
VVAGVILLLIAPAIALLLSSEIKRDKERDRLLNEEGVQTTATVERVWRESNKEGSHMVAYRFTVDGNHFSSTSKLHRSAWVRLNPGDPLPIRYARQQPSINYPVSGAPGPAPGWLPWAMAPLFIWPSIFFWFLIRRQSQLLAEGRPAPGTVTKIRRAKQLAVHYEFPILSGETIKGRCQVNRRSTLQTGAPVCVLYMPDNPRRNGIYPLELVKLDK